MSENIKKNILFFKQYGKKGNHMATATALAREVILLNRCNHLDRETTQGLLDLIAELREELGLAEDDTPLASYRQLCASLSRRRNRNPNPIVIDLSEDEGT